uniref:Uncharacterized protein n=1 Tax=Anguilla anguilla TaxID=7936 RepID=A0A0E9UVZ1_ANGAN
MKTFVFSHEITSVYSSKIHC